MSRWEAWDVPRSMGWEGSESWRELTEVVLSVWVHCGVCQLVRNKSVETQDYVSALPQTCRMEQKIEADEKNTGELSFVSSAVSEPHWALHKCDRASSLPSSSKSLLLCQKKEAQRTRSTIPRSATMKGEWNKVKKRWLVQSGGR